MSSLGKHGLRTLGAGICLAGAWLGGCVDSNHRTTIGDTIKPAVFQPGLGTMRENDGPSLVSVGRTEWEAVTYEVPVDGVGHRPNYRTHWLLDRSNARKRGEFPTASTAFDIGKSGDWAQTEEVLVAPVNQMFDALTIPVLLFVEPQTLEMRSPYRHFERTPKGSVMPDPTRLCEEACKGCDSCQVDAPTETPVEGAAE